MIHLRIVAPAEVAAKVAELLAASPAACNLVVLPGAARKPAGDVILCDVAREEASVLIADLRELEVHKVGSIALEQIDSQLSAAADRAQRAARGAPADAVVWEEVEANTSESIELSGNFLAFMTLACLLASIALYIGSPILLVGAMVVGPEFGPLAGICVALVERRHDVARRSLLALAIGFPVGITAAFLLTLFAEATDLIAADFSTASQPLTHFVSHPEAFSVLVAAVAGVTGILSLTSAKSGALIGVLVSVTTIPAAANIGVAAATGDWSDWRGAMAQLTINLSMIVLAGLATLFVERLVYRRRRLRHFDDSARAAAGLPGRRRQ